MAIDLRKDTAPREASQLTGSSGTDNREGSSRIGLGFEAEAKQDLGIWGGINVEAEAKVSIDIEAEIRSQGLTIDTDPNTGSMSLGAGLGSAKGKLGGNIGVELGVNDQGEIEITGARGEVSIAGFGGNIEVNRDGSGSLGAEIGGLGVEVSRDEEGKPSLTLSYGFGPAEVSITFSPDEEREIPIDEPDPVGVGSKIQDIPLEILKNNCLYYVIYFQHGAAVKLTFDKPLLRTGSHHYYEQGTWTSTGEVVKKENLPISHYSPGFIEWHDYPTGSRAGYKINDTDGFAQLQGYGSYSPATIEGSVAISYSNGNAGYLYNYGAAIKDWIDYWVMPNSAWDFSIIEISCTGNPPNTPPKALTPIQGPTSSPSPSFSPLGLPNYPQHPKRMDCCDKIEEIYKYLGIAKLKKHKFKVAKQFLAPGGKGTEDAEDYYQITQALFRMLANGLILNPKSKPLGSEWQNVNATAWASQMYEMMAESMSDGNSTQRVEISTIMQLVQMMSLLAETSRKVELIIDALDIEPNLVSEELPVCFTIHESHKGFGKKEPKKIDTTKLKTDNDVEAVLGKMLIPSKIPIVKWEFKPGSISVVEALKNGN